MHLIYNQYLKVIATKPIIIIMLVFSVSICNSQSNIYLIDGQSLDSLPLNMHWYSINANQSIKECSPKIDYDIDENNNFDGYILSADSTSVLIVGTKLKLLNTEDIDFPFADKVMGPNSSLTLSTNEILFVKMIKSENEENEIFSINIFYKDSYEESEIFRSCRQLKTTDQYYGCGRMPLKIEFYGDLTNDGIPEILLSAEKEGGIVNILIGKEKRIYTVLYSYES